MHARSTIKSRTVRILYFIIATIPFPYFITYAGRDALTFTTLLILVLSLFLPFGMSFKQESTFNAKAEYILPVLIAISTTLSFLLNPGDWGQNLRYYIANVSGIILYFLVIRIINEFSQVKLIVNVLLIVLILQVVLGGFQIFLPSAAEWLVTPFATRTELSLASVTAENVMRATGSIFDYELLAEWFLLGVFLSVMLLCRSEATAYLLAAVFLSMGIVFTKTRSCIVLLIAGIIFVTLALKFLKKDSGRNSYLMLLIIPLGLVFSFVAFEGQTEDFVDRFFLGGAASLGSVVDVAAARREGWEYGLSYLENLTFFGNGLDRLVSIFSTEFSFHSLYLSLLYRFGVFGFGAHLFFWVFVLGESFKGILMYRDSADWVYLFFLSFCLFLMLVDNVKIEYLRYSYTVQFAWLVNALVVVSLRQIRVGWRGRNGLDKGKTDERTLGL
jgi:hypothetical protein